MKKETEKIKRVEEKDYRVKTEALNKWADGKLQELSDELGRKDCAMLCLYLVGEKITYFYANRSLCNLFKFLYNAMVNDDELRRTAIAAAIAIRHDDVEWMLEKLKEMKDGDAAV